MTNDHQGKYWVFNHFSNINATLQALITDGKARVLSRPNVTTMSGETANILVGGEIPVPVPSTNGSSNTFEWKEYGIKLEIKPTADADNNITSIVHAEVSRLDYSNAVTTNSIAVPAIAKREATASVNIPTGMTMAIGGLMNTEDTRTVTRIPLLSNIPILGELFKHNSTSRDKREIIILITPRVVNETTSALMSDKAYNVYKEGRKDDADRKPVDLNQPLPQKTEQKKNEDNSSQAKSVQKPDTGRSTEPALKQSADTVKQSESIAKQAAESDENTENQQDDSILGKYLNRNVLPKEESTK